MSAPDVDPTAGVPSRRQRMFFPVLTATLVALMVLALRLHDPHSKYSWGLCPLRELTGLDCPGCGGLRAVNDLTHFQVADALRSNFLFVLSIPLLLGLWFVWARAAWTSTLVPISRKLRNQLSWWAVVFAVAFAVYRNTPWGAWAWA